MERTVLFSKNGSLPVGWVAAMALLLFFLVGHESGANAQSHSHDPGEGLGEFLHERNLFKQTGHQGAHSRTGRGNADERENGFQGFVHDSFF